MNPARNVNNGSRNVNFSRFVVYIIFNPHFYRGGHEFHKRRERFMLNAVRGGEGLGCAGVPPIEIHSEQ